VIGFIAGLAFFRIWLAVLVGTCVAAASFGVYFVNVLEQPLIDYLNRPPSIELREAGQTPEAAESARMMAHMTEHVPNMQTSVFAILASTGLAGIIFGLLLPKFSRALWAASTGTVFFLAALIGIIEVVSPELQERMLSLGSWGWVIVAAVWAASLAYNMYDCRDKHPKKPVKDEEVEAEPAPA
jgi:hypothetical protein